MEERIGCTNVGCAFDKPNGMATNGMCNCLDGLHPVKKRKVIAWVRRAKARIAELEALCEQNGIGTGSES